MVLGTSEKHEPINTLLPSIGLFEEIAQRPYSFVRCIPHRKWIQKMCSGATPFSSEFENDSVEIMTINKARL